MSEDELDDLLESLDSDQESALPVRRKRFAEGGNTPRKKKKSSLNAYGKEASDRRKMDSQRSYGWTSDNFDAWCEKGKKRNSAKKEGQERSWDLPRQIRGYDSDSKATDPQKKRRNLKEADPWAFQDERVQHLESEISGMNVQKPTGVREYKAFQKAKHEYTERLFEIMNRYIFENAFQLKQNLHIDWSKSLNKTAGQCCFKKNSKNERVAVVKLASKILDTYDKLKQTLCHELIHAYTWVVLNKPKPPHGPQFQKWGRKAHEIFPDIEVTTCHTYEIHFKYQWQCTTCGNIYGRHSKSIKIEKVLCGKCRKGRLVYLGRNKR